MEEQTPERIDPISLFPQAFQQTAVDLTWLGYLSRSFPFCGKVFVMETIRPHMKYAISQALEPWRNTLSEPQAWGSLHVGVALTSIDGDTAFCPQMQEDPVEFARARLAWLTGPQGYFEPVIDYLFGKYLEMEQEVAQAIAELHRLSERGRPTSQLSPDSLTAPEPSSDAIAGDIPPSEPSS